MDLYLIRHAQSENNAKPVAERVADPPLSSVGHRQAELLAQWILSFNLSRLITSPFLRTLQTTEHLHRATQLQVDVRPQLHEQGGCYSGHAAMGRIGQPGMSRREIEQAFPGFDIAAEIDGEGWWRSQPYEDRDRASRRACALLAQTQAELGHSNERIAYIMHGDIKVLLLELIHGQSLQGPHNTSVTTLQIGPDEARLSQYNRVDHLPASLITC